MAGLTRGLERGARRILAELDRVMNRLYGWRHNPVYHSGALVVVSLLVLLATGVYLLLFYRIGAPYESIEGLQAQWWGGRWIRAVHRYASDVAVVAVAVHALRMFAQGRSWGPRATAWVSGLVLLFVFLVCGWTGFVMVWDTQAQLLAAEGARWLDVLPLFSEPISRAFVGEDALPSAFFFLNLFLHILLPIALALLLWIHVSRLARPALLPPRALLWGLTGGLIVLSLVWPAPLGPGADLRRLPGEAPLDLFYAFWLPWTRGVPAGWVWLSGSVAAALLVLVPVWARRRPERAATTGTPPSPLIQLAGLEPSVVNTRMCTGCRQCYLDCPYEAIAMVPRLDGREGMVAEVDPVLCVSCGICAGSCAPMGVGPPGRTGRDQLVAVRRFTEAHRPGPGDVVVVACDRGAGRAAAAGLVDGSPVFGVACAGSLHTSVLEYLVRSGVAGVLVVSCPPRDCWNREGVKWLEARVYEDREAELQARVDRRRVRLAVAAEAERGRLVKELRAYRSELQALAEPAAESRIEIDTTCDVPEEAEAAVQ